MPDLVMVVPSRGRPEAAAELARACRDTCTANTWLFVVVDSDDDTLPRYAAPEATTVFYAWGPPNAGHVGAINYGARRALAEFDPWAIGKLDDDHRPRTKGWDTLLLAELKRMRTGIVYGNDLLQGQRLPTAPVMTADIVKALGYMGPPQLWHLYVDDFWRDLGEQADCLRYVPDVVVEHMHPTAGKAPMDDGYRRANSARRYRDDGAAYDLYKAERMAGDVAKVRALRQTRG